MLKPICGFFKCLFGVHHVPERWAYEYIAAIFAGGVCPRCGVVKQGKFLCNLWTATMITADGVVELTGHDITTATRLGYEIRGNLGDLVEEFQERKKAKRNAAS